jgi:hypothetical protein
VYKDQICSLSFAPDLDFRILIECDVTKFTYLVTSHYSTSSSSCYLPLCSCCVFVFQGNMCHVPDGTCRREWKANLGFV